VSQVSPLFQISTHLPSTWSFVDFHRINKSGLSIVFQSAPMLLTAIVKGTTFKSIYVVNSLLTSLMQDQWKYKSLGIAAAFIGNQSHEDAY